MPRRSLEVNVEPKILIWARESIGLSKQEVANKLSVSENTMSKWESGEKKLKLTHLEKLAKICKRPLATFFLQNPPEERPFPKDFRTLPEDKRKPFSSKTRLAIRRARRLQSLTSELAKSLSHKIVTEIERVSVSDNPEIVASRIREQSRVTIQTQFGWRDDIEALNEWRKTVEDRGVLVFQVGVPLKETRGFSLTEGKSPVIVLNLRDAIKGRIFSLFHEYGHLLLNHSGICDMGEQDYLSDENKLIEKFCNHFAGAFLVPKNALINHKLVGEIKSSVEWSDEVLEKLAKDFKVSKEVILRRLVIMDRVKMSFYKRKHEEWKSKKYPRGWGRKNPPKKCIQENGVPFVSLVLETHRKGRITYSDVADYLAIRLKHLPKVEKIISGSI